MERFPRSTNDGARRPAASWLSACFCAAILLFGSAATALGTDSEPLFDQSAWRDDGFPFQPRHDAEALRAIWSTFETGATSEPFTKAVTLQLLKQGPRYKGKLLSVEGRLLRADRIALSQDESCYDLWILLPDSKRDPVRLLTRQAPEGFELGPATLPKQAGDRNVQYRRETLRATAVYYRTTAYDAGDDLLAAPTLVAESFTTVDARENENDQSSQPGGGRLVKITAILAIVALWFALRSRMKKGKRRAPGPGATALALLVMSFAPSSSPAQDLDGPSFWGKLAGVAPEEWTLEIGDGRPRLDEGTPESAQRRAVAIAILGIPDRLLTSDALLDRAKNGETETVQGVLKSVGTIALSPAEEERLGAERICRATIMVDDGTNAAIYLVKPPAFQAPDSFFDRPRVSTNAPGIGDRVETLGIKFGSEANDEKTFLATRLRWRPDDAPLGRLGVDLSAFETVPVYSPAALEKAATKEEREKIALATRWTTADRRAFYGSLAGFKRNDARDVDRRTSADVVSLFNAPEKLQGAHVRLKGWVRRVNMILVTDPEIKAETGIERYFQLFLFTNDSQGWPVVLCAPELPDGLETGGGSDYRRELDFDGFFYKTWAYKAEGISAAASSENSETLVDAKSAKRWTRAPVVVGRIVHVEPEDNEASAPWSPTEFFVSFALLACAWIVLRHIARERQKPKSLSHN